MYRPNFCAECGERVVRARWRVWTSRRFCAACAGRFRRGRVFKSVVLAALLAGGGFVLGRAGRPKPPPLVVERGALQLAPVGPPKTESGSAREGEGAAKPETRYGPDGTPSERPTEPDEVVSVCGARTQKGTPCQRRVRGTGRCWQHRGKAAILPLEKRVTREAP